jgi:hypothetical protein
VDRANRNRAAAGVNCHLVGVLARRPIPVSEFAEPRARVYLAFDDDDPDGGAPGRAITTRRLDVDFPAGVEEGEVIRVETGGR